jgi:hypothetical protein
VVPGSPIGASSTSSYGLDNALLYLIKQRHTDHRQLLRMEDKEHNELLSMRNSKEQEYDEYNWRARYSTQWIHLCYRHVVIHRNLSASFEKILSLFCAMLKHQQAPQLRAKVLKLLSPLMKTDSGLFSRPNIRGAVCERFNDSSIMVREESIKLVGINVLKEEEGGNGEFASSIGTAVNELQVDTMSWYLDGLLVRLRDKGVSVRKTVVNLLMAVLFSQPWHPRYSQICQCLLEVAAMPQEEASVKDIIRNALHRIWFSPPPPAVVARAQLHYKNFGALASSSPQSSSSSEQGIAENTARISVKPGDCEPISDTRVEEALIAQSLLYKTNDIASTISFPVEHHIKSTVLSYVDIAALQIVDVICRSGNDTAWLVSMLRDILHGGSFHNATEEKGESKLRRVEARRHCEHLLNSLTEAMLRVEEGNPESIQRLVAARRSGSAQIVAIITVISAFCEVWGYLKGFYRATLLNYYCFVLLFFRHIRRFVCLI